MRLLHVIASMDPKQGGVSQAVRSMINGLDGERVDNEVVTLDTADQSFLLDGLIPVIHSVGPARGPWRHSSNLIPWLLRNFSRFDGVIVHGLWLYPGFAVRRALKQYTNYFQINTAKKHTIPKLFVMPHGMLDPYFQTAPGRRFKAWRNNLYWNLIESKTINSADNILFTCEEECRLAKVTFKNYKPKAEAVVGLGVEKPPPCNRTLIEAFAQKHPAIVNSSYLLFLSRINEKKGLDLLVNAYSLIVQEIANSTTKIVSNTFPKLIIAGPGMETAFGQRIQKSVSASSLLSENVIFTGMLTGDVKWGAFYGCEAFILPSHQENFGIAVVEAMACKKPVLISDKINIWREIQSTGSGIIKSADLSGIKELLRLWLQLNIESKELMGSNAYKLFQRTFAVEAASKQLTTVLL